MIPNSNPPITLQDQVCDLQRKLALLADWTTKHEAFTLRPIHVSVTNLAVEFASSDADRVGTHFKARGFDAWNPEFTISHRSMASRPRSMFLMVDGVTVRVWGKTE